MSKRSGGIEQYNRWIRFYTRTTTPDSYGGQTISWATGVRRRARIRLIYGQTNYLSTADQEVATKRLEIRIRKASDVTPAPATMRVRLDDGARYLDIESSDVDLQKREYIMLCKEVDQ